MNKVIRDGKVAVLISIGYGAGWTTWEKTYGDDLYFDPRIVEMIENGAPDTEIEDYVEHTYPDVFLGGIDGLIVQWVPEGMKFTIREVDGAETITTEEDVQKYWMTA